jgi:hypothetical protein
MKQLRILFIPSQLIPGEYNNHYRDMLQPHQYIRNVDYKIYKDTLRNLAVTLNNAVIWPIWNDMGKCFGRIR